ncbi:MAG: hypothetical protein FJ000_09185, partial [Actinobacteria bacterium]|nr:hypothetical protein [Actinomycetota bacterium]
MPASISERYERAVQFLPWVAQRQLRAVPVGVRWWDTARLSYRVRTADGWEVVLLDAETGARRRFRADDLAAAVGVSTGRPPAAQSPPL